MSIEPGERLGRYEIVAPLGAGAMGEVYRARDTRLDRIVAVKVISASLAQDDEARSRFEQEARTIAALNDPHICTIHDVGRHGEADYLVLEYLEGEPLDKRLDRPPVLSIKEALGFAIQIGRGLDRAHHAGIAHRDLKPGNVMLVAKPESAGPGDVKLMDFGLASRTAARRSKALPALNETISASIAETRGAGGANVSGLSGTLQYISPEQLNGSEGDERADIFAFGCLLYEMLAGRKAFEGTTALMVLAAIASAEPPPIERIAGAHPLLDHVLRRCLEKDPERRWQSIRDAVGELQWIADRLDAAPASAAAVAPPPPALLRLALPAALVLAGAAAIWAWAARTGPAPVDLPAMTFTIATAPTGDSSVAVSPDGRYVAFVADRDGDPMLWVRPLAETEGRILPGTTGATQPFWSPDGRTVAFFAEDKLKRIDLSGDRPVVVADAPNARGGTWGRDGTILFAPGVSASIVRVASRGGATEPVTRTGADTGPSHRWPQFLPDGRRFLFSSALGPAATNGVYLASLDGTAAPVRLLPDDGGGRFVAPDHLLTLRQGALQAYAFDERAGRVTGEPTVVATGLAPAAAGVFSTSDTGVLAYRAGAAQLRQLAWVDRQGRVVDTVGAADSDAASSPELSPDGQSVAVFRQRGGDNDVWVIELARKLERRLTTAPPANSHPLWDPDAKHIVYTRLAGSGGPIRQALSAGAPEPLFAAAVDGQAISWSRDRRYVLVRRERAGAGDLVALSTDASHSEVVVTASPHDEAEGQFSPDGRWVAFVSNESGHPEVFVQSFPTGESRTQASTKGGAQVRWADDGREIFYVAPDHTLMAVPFDVTAAAPTLSLPVALFKVHLASGRNVLGRKPQYAVARDGRFLLNSAVESAASPVVVAVNWTKKLAR